MHASYALVLVEERRLSTTVHLGHNVLHRWREGREGPDLARLLSMRPCGKDYADDGEYHKDHNNESEEPQGLKECLEGFDDDE